MKVEERIYRNSETSEKAFERRLTEKAREWRFMVVKNCDPMMSGMPDRLIVMPDGKTVWVELKSAGKDLSELQKSRVKKLQELGHTVFVIKSKEDLELVLGYLKYFKP